MPKRYWMYPIPQTDVVIAQGSAEPEKSMYVFPSPDAPLYAMLSARFPELVVDVEAHEGAAAVGIKINADVTGFLRDAVDVIAAMRFAVDKATAMQFQIELPL